MTFTELAAAGVIVDIRLEDDNLLYHFQWKNMHYKHAFYITELSAYRGSINAIEDSLVGLVMREFGGFAA